MEQQAIQNLDRAVALMRSPKIVRALRHPIRMFGSKLTERKAHAKGCLSALATTFWGAPFHAMIPEAVSTTIYRYGFFEEELTRAFIDILKPGMTFFDVGSHFGYFRCWPASWSARRGGARLRPDPSTFQMLKKNVGHFSNVTTVNAAAFSRRRLLNSPTSALSSARTTRSGPSSRVSRRPSAALHRVNVQAITIDGYTERTGVKPGAMKIDAEGAELEILGNGARSPPSARS